MQVIKCIGKGTTFRKGDFRFVQAHTDIAA